jgi:hypothetical protein
MSEADRLYFEALNAIKEAADQQVGPLSSNTRRVAAAKADISDALMAHGVDLIIQALMLDLQEDIELRKKVGVECRVAEKKLEMLSKALYCSIRNADKPVIEIEEFEELDE